MDSVSRRNVVLLFVSRALRSFAAGFMGVIIGLYLLHGIGLSPIAIGALFAVGALSTPAISLLVGRLGDIYGRKTVLIIDMLTLPLGIAILLTTRNVYLLGLSMGLGGFGMAGGLVGGGVGASVAPVLTALLAENSDEKNRTTIYSINSQINTFAGAAGAAIISFASYRLLFKIGLTLSLLSVAFVLPVRERFRRDPLGNGRPATLSDSDKRFIKIFGYTGLLNGIGMGLVSPFLPIIFNQFFGMNSSQIGFLMSAGGIISGIGYSFSTYLARRLGLVNLIVLSRGIASTLTFLIPFSPSAAVASFLYLVSTPIRMISLPAQSSLQMSLIGEGSRATASGLNQAARQFPQAVSTLLTGFMIGALPVYVPFGLAALFNYANSYLYLKFFSRLPGTKSQNGPQN